MKSKYLLILSIILFSVFWIWWLPGLRVANDFSFISNDWLKLQFDVPRTWNERGAEGLGEYGVFTLWSYPVNFIFGVLANYLGLNFQMWERILVFLYILLGCFSIWKLLSKYSLSDKSKFIGSVFYLINTYPILLFDGGQISIALAYALFPLAFLSLDKAIYAGTRKKILAGLIISILGFFDFRFLFIIFLLILIKMFIDIFEHLKNNPVRIFWKYFHTGLVISIVVTALNAYWLMPFIKVPIDKDIFTTFTSISASIMNIGHPLLVISPHWFKNVFGQVSPLRVEFILLPILAFAAPLLRRKDKAVFFWLLTAIVSIFLAKGGAEPLSFVYPWLHLHIPGFSLFRDSTKFFFLIALSFAVLISVSSEEILRICSKVKYGLLRGKLAVFFTVFIVLYLLYLIRPVFLSQMTGTFSMQPAEEKFMSLTNILQNDKNFGRVFWIPSTVPLSYSDLNHPIIEAARVFSRVPFVYGVKGSYEIFNFLREASYMGEIFDVSAISYIAYPAPDIRRDRLSADDIKYYDTFLKQLTNLPWIEKAVLKSEVPLLKVKSHQDKIFITQNTWVVFGSDEVFKEATKSSNLKLSNNAVILAEYQPETGPLISTHSEAKIVLNKKTNTDLLASFIPKQQIIFPAAQLTIDPDKTGWWKNDGKNLISWRDFLQSKYGFSNNDFDLGGGWAIAEGNLSLNIRNEKLKKNSMLFVRAMESSRSGTLSFYQDNNLIGNINTRSDTSGVRWIEVGLLQETADLTIKAEGDINIINALALVDESSLLLFRDKSRELLKRVADFKPENIIDKFSTISYQKINQTKYKILVTGLTSPQIIVFSSTFHPLWKLNDQDSIPVYGFLNGFRVSKDGEYILEFTPQRYVTKGLVISLLTGFFVFYFLLTHKERHL